jgi:hypothetical protein
MDKLWELYKKELKGRILINAFLASGILLWSIFVYYKFKSGNIGREEAFGLTMLSIGVLILVLIWFGYREYSKEIEQNTIYSILQLPLSSWQLVGVKLVAAMTYYLSLLILVYLIAWLGYSNFIINSLSSSDFGLEFGVKAGFNSLAVGFYCYLLGQFSYLVAKYFNIVNFLANIIIIFVSSYFFNVMTRLFAYFFSWLPYYESSLTKPYYDGSLTSQFFKFELNFQMDLLGTSLLLVCVFIINSWLIQNKLDI